MKEYELIWERFNPCSGDQHAQTSVKELSLSDPAAYVHQQFHLEKKLRIEQSQAGESLVFECVHTREQMWCVPSSLKTLDC